MTIRELKLDDSVPQLDTDRWVYLEFSPQGQFAMHASPNCLEDPQMLVTVLTQVLVNHVYRMGIQAGATQLAQQIEQAQAEEAKKPHLVLPGRR